MPQLVRAHITMPDFELDHPPFRLNGTVIAALLNHEGEWRAIGPLAEQPPCDSPPCLPVLGVRPPTALARDGDAWQVPAGAEGILAAATLGSVIGRPACRISAEQSLAFVAGYLVVNNGSLPVSSHYRPAMRKRVRDGLCVLGTRLTPACAVRDPDGLELSIRVDDRVVQTCDTGHRVRGVSRLVDAADVPDPHRLMLSTRVNGELRQRGSTADLVNDIPVLIEYLGSFMTLHPDDVILTGTPEGASNVDVGDEVVTEIDGIGRLVNTIVGDGDFGI